MLATAKIRQSIICSYVVLWHIRLVLMSGQLRESTTLWNRVDERCLENMHPNAVKSEKVEVEYRYNLDECH